MALISSEIDSVRAYELPCGIWADGEYVGTPRRALVKWKSSLSDKLYQIYVNDQFAGATLDCQQKQMIVPIPTSFESAVRIEVFAVEAEQADTDFSNELIQPATDSGRVKISLLRSQNLPIDSTAEIYFDNGTGEIDYDKPLCDSPIKIWPAWQDKAGFAMGRFGVGDFGYESAAAVGLGKGSFGYSLFGFDADTIKWISPSLQAGIYKFGVKLIDKEGNQSSANETEPITVTPAAKPAAELSIALFDKQTNQLALEVTN
jgi:hypothetical protein